MFKKLLAVIFLLWIPGILLSEIEPMPIAGKGEVLITKPHAELRTGHIISLLIDIISPFQATAKKGKIHK